MQDYRANCIAFELLLDSLHTASLHFTKTEMDVLQCNSKMQKYVAPMLLERVTTIIVTIEQHDIEQNTRALAQIRKHYLLSHAS